MSEGSSSIRLSKAAREFNVGTSTIVEFLNKKGHQIDSNPNTKLTPEVYALLVKEYQKEKQVKEISQKLGIEASGRKTITAEDVVRLDIADEEEYEPDEVRFKNIQSNLIEKTSSGKTAKTKTVPVESKPVVESQKEPQESIASVSEKPAEPTKEAETIAVEGKVEQPEPETAKSKKPESSTPEKEKTAETLIYKPVEHESSQPDGELKIVGKIDLDSLNLKTKPDKKSKAERKKEEEKRKKATEKPAETKKTVTPKPEVKAEEVVVEPKAPEPESKPEDSKPSNFIKMEVKKLEGPKILDKIVLPEERKPKAKPVASSSEEKLSASQKKKKRKRIKGNEQGAAQTAAGGQQSPTGQQRGAQGKTTAEHAGLQREGKKAKHQTSRKEEKVELTEEEIQKQIRDTLARLSPTGKSKTSKHKRQKREAFSHSQADRKSVV